LIKKNEILTVLTDCGLSIIECERVLENKEYFRLAIEDIMDHAVADGWQKDGTFKHKEKIHYPYKNLYLCNQAYIAIKRKVTKDKTKITCKNCLHKLAKGNN